MSIAKIDIDVKMPRKRLRQFINTRVAIINALGYNFIKYRYVETQKGYHFWFYVMEKLSAKELAWLQFMLGDDQTRCRFNFIRLNAGCFHQFNVLFNKKLKK